MTKPAALLAAIALLSVSGSLPMSHAARRPISAEDAGQCTTPGSCADDSLQRRKDRLREELKAKLGVGRKDDDDKDKKNGGGDDVDISKIVPHDLSKLGDALSDYFETDGVTSMMQKHLERALFAKKYPDGAKDTDYVDLGTLLDISTISSSTWSGSTYFNSKSPWISSLLNRRSLIGDGKPCKVTSVNSDEASDDGDSCIVAATVHTFVKISGTEEAKREEMALAAEFGILGIGKGSFLTGNVMDMSFARKFDTIVANGILETVDSHLDSDALPAEDMDLVLEKLISLLRPGGTLWLVGTEPLSAVEGPGAVSVDVMHALDSAKSLWGEYPKRKLSAKWINRTLDRLGCPVFSSTLFPVEYSLDDMEDTINEAREWIDDHEGASSNFKKQYHEMLAGLESHVEDAMSDGPVFAGEHTYIVGAHLP